MTVPAPVCTVTPNTVTRTASDITPQVMLADTSTPSPAASGRTWEADTVAIKSTVGASGAGISTSVPYPVNLAAGARNIRVKTTNTDGTGTSGNVTLTVTDQVASGQVNITDPNLVVRQNPIFMPYEYRDPTLITPGPVTASGTYNARTRGYI